MTIYKCHYGCGQDAILQNKSGNWMCSTSSNKCPVNRNRNSLAVRKAHSEGRIPGWNQLSESGLVNRAWRKGLDKTDQRVLNNALSVSKSTQGRKGIKHSKEAKLKMSEKRLQTIAIGKYDTSGRKGHRGHYNETYFHSSWELAYYVFQLEVHNILLKRNSEYFEYISNDRTYKTIPDFVLPDNTIVEIKGYLFSERDKDKFKQTHHLIKYLFKPDLDECLKYCISKYGKKFWETLYV